MSQSLHGVSPGHSQEPLIAFPEDSPPLRDISVITQASLSPLGSHHSLLVTEAPSNTPRTARVSFQLMLLQGWLDTEKPGNVKGLNTLQQ